MKKLVLASAAAIGLLGLAACSDSADNTTTQSTTPPPAIDNTTTPNAAPAPQTGTGGDTQGSPPAQPAPAPAQ
ncbi:hypothetical protein [Kumtagia ephedrae]|uniref:Immunogenic protein n=1 Tax=Kumtagia ephedrae TaxID=2116701 RepID=A0A2P7SR33_9HYPH|nr:hypothetical protein [Mesorhizobium ephedrae]PSJ64952.1 hypothetical protein C7I84_04360 [Mesorhizobium ephedrae]